MRSNKAKLVAYDNMVIHIAKTSDMYDGRGKGVDIYLCRECQKVIMTRYKDKGVTPFSMWCKCKGSLVHTDTIGEQTAKALGHKVLDWYRPSFEEFLKLSEWEQEYVLNGGLILKEND